MAELETEDMGALQPQAASVPTEGGAMPTLKPFWLSWWGQTGIFELHSPWWITGYRGDGEDEDDEADTSICAAVMAESEFQAKCIIDRAHDEGRCVGEWRFCKERPEGWEPFSDRFRRADWMLWGETASLGTQSQSDGVNP